MIEIRGVIADKPSGNPRLTIFMHKDGERTGELITYPSYLPIHRAAINSYIANKYSVSTSQVSWRTGVSIPI